MFYTPHNPKTVLRLMQQCVALGMPHISCVTSSSQVSLCTLRLNNGGASCPSSVCVGTVFCYCNKQYNGAFIIMRGSKPSCNILRPSVLKMDLPPCRKSSGTLQLLSEFLVGQEVKEHRFLTGEVFSKFQFRNVK